MQSSKSDPTVGVGVSSVIFAGAMPAIDRETSRESRRIARFVVGGGVERLAAAANDAIGGAG